MNLNLHCFIPQCNIAQTPFVYVPFFQSYPQYQFIVPFQNYYAYPQQSEQVINIQESIPQSDPQQITNQSQQLNNEHQSTSEPIKNELNVTGLVQKNNQKNTSYNKNNQLQFQKESKNIQKNYAKAIASFISKNKLLASKLLTYPEVDVFIDLIKSLKNKIQNVCHISQYTNNQDFIKAFRILGNYFLKNRSNSYIFNSRIQKKNSHLRHKLLIHHSLLKC